MISNFIFDGEYASDYGLVLCNFSGTEDSKTISDVEFNTFQPARLEYQLFTDAKYSNMLSKTIQVIKMKDCDALEMSPLEIEKIAHWLCKTDGYHKFIWIDDKDPYVQEVYYNAQINMELVYVGGKVFGLSLTINTNAPYGFTDYKEEFETSSHIIKTRSSSDGVIYLNMEIQVLSAGDLKIGCSYGGKTYTSIIKNCKAGEVITITENNVITSSDSSHAIMNDFNFIFPRIYDKYDATANQISINLSHKTTILFKAKRKVGL